jgi:hypothetical protein
MGPAKEKNILFIGSSQLAFGLTFAGGLDYFTIYSILYYKWGGERYTKRWKSQSGPPLQAYKLVDAPSELPVVRFDIPSAEQNLVLQEVVLCRP